MPEIIEHPQTKARNLIVEIDDPGIGKYSVTGNPMNMSESPASYERGAPLMGQDTVNIMKELGYSDRQIQKLYAKKVIQ